MIIAHAISDDPQYAGGKPCNTCAKWRPMDYFYLNSRSRDGRQHKCIPCAKKWHSDYYYENREALLSEMEKYRDENGEQIRQRARERNKRDDVKKSKALYAAAYKKENKEKAQARVAVNSAVRSGELERPVSCPACGSSGGPIDAHHEDYSKPLDVMWMCRKCHMAKHNKGKRK